MLSSPHPDEPILRAGRGCDREPGKPERAEYGGLQKDAASHGRPSKIVYAIPPNGADELA
ncbi:hypothetical protein Ate02nite_54630 [Paractinoplanes tereljensis]|uniref:Uncharacterized protein n=1 Tax=Paractinoplanes tereljensis TaxID=571912 RepID=A0A919NQD0_9ACTN|nr:hypothetical protein Ate02nite_54630 [Actinoplanes tereljensis]